MTPASNSVPTEVSQHAPKSDRSHTIMEAIASVFPLSGCFLLKGRDLNIIALQTDPVLSWHTFKATGFKYCWLHKHRIQPLWFQDQTLWGFIFPVWAPWCFLNPVNSSLPPADSS